MTYTPKPISTDNVSLSPELTALGEKLSASIHDVWAQGRISEGWTYGPARDDSAKTNPCLVEYDQLPESEKEYDRRSVFETLKGIVALGWRISRED